jgi:prevent-host-death family protein
MRSIAFKTLSRKLKEYVRLAARGETVLVTDRGRVVAEIVPPRGGRGSMTADEMLAQAVREGLITPALITDGTPPPRKPIMPFETLMTELRRDRDGR